MTLDEALVDTVVRALRPELTALRDEMAQLRKSLPPMLGTVKDACRILGCCAGTVRKLMKQGRVRTVGSGTGLRIDLASLQPEERGDGE